MEPLEHNTTWTLHSGNVSSEQTITTKGQIVSVYYDLGNVMLAMFEFVLTFCSFSINGGVLFALCKIPKKDKFKSKLLLGNSLLADILCSIGNLVTGGIYVAISLGLDKNTYGHCCLGFKLFSVTTFQYSQAWASVVLCLDRVYAVIAPMAYYTKGYSSRFTVFINCLVWCISFLLVSPFLLTNTDLSFCKGLYANRGNWASELRYPIQITIQMSILIVYIGLFLRVKYQKSIWTKRTENTNSSSKQSIRLIVTFFALHLTTFLLFLPGPAFGVMINIGLVRTSHRKRILIASGLSGLYSLNCVVNPIILAIKVPVIKAQLWNIWKANKSTKPQNDRRQTTEQTF